MSKEIMIKCPYCGHHGEAETFEREYYGHLAPSTICPECRGGF